MSEQPATRIDRGHVAAFGLPIGLAIIGRRFDDLCLLQVAHTGEPVRSAARSQPAPRATSPRRLSSLATLTR